MSSKLHLKSLTIQNLGIIENQTIDFSSKFNAIIGETGSGKSLILDAIELIIGFRGDKKLVRKDADFLIVEGVFSSQDETIKQFFHQAGYPFEDEISIKRIIYKEGSSKTFINYQTGTLQFIKTFARKYVDLVGQFENQKLLSSEYQLKLLDLYGVPKDLIDNYKKTFAELKELKLQRDRLIQNSENGTERRDYIEFQLRLLEDLNPTAKREQELIHQKEKLKGKMEMRKSLEEINEIFEGSNHSPGLQTMLDRLERLVDQDTFTEKEKDQFFNAKEYLMEILFKTNLEQSTAFPQEDFDAILEELNSYQKLKRKFNTDIFGLEMKKREFEEEITELNNFDERKKELESSIDSFYQSAKKQAEEIHNHRISAAHKLSIELTENVKNLNMKNATMKIEVEEGEELSSTGFSKVGFMAETNLGEGFYRIRDIASGGELSRILLAVRNILAAKDSISIFLFDEIDTGIGGETALCVGNAIETVSRNSQVITITHLPQIAKFADTVVKVEKLEDSARTIAHISAFSGQRKLEEVSSMIPLS